VVQRLKWAAGANPALAQTLQLYEEALGMEQSAVEVRRAPGISHSSCHLLLLNKMPQTMSLYLVFLNVTNAVD
jgi:hypothetical protein